MKTVKYSSQQKKAKSNHNMKKKILPNIGESKWFFVFPLRYQNAPPKRGENITKKRRMQGTSIMGKNKSFRINFQMQC